MSNKLIALCGMGVLFSSIKWDNYIQKIVVIFYWLFVGGLIGVRGTAKACSG